MTPQGLYLGTTGADGTALELGPDHLTTHAVCLGMTGSGKTGLGIIALEELARRGIPLLIIDLKGDMTNLLLNFPELDARSFEPWLPPDAVTAEGSSQAAERIATEWRAGLTGSGLSGADLQAVRSGVSWQLLTPGLASGAPLDILPALAAPAGWSPDDDPDGATERVNAVTAALLSLIGRGGDPLTDRDQVLVATIVMELWRRGKALDLAGLLASIADPPIQTLGVMPLESVYPRVDRIKLVMALNTLLASPAFAAWTRGTPLAMEALLGSPGAPRATIVTIAHLGEQQRLFALTLLASELMAWTRRQPASAGLKALLYIDELQGILPPSANPPCKAPLLTLLKQGRAFGVGAWLASQNPVDIDYKALGNAGVKMIGRLVTDRDRERALEGLGMTGATAAEVDRQVASLGKRQFLLVDVRSDGPPRVFSTRWAMSYLRGPLTVAEMRPLLATSASSSASTGAAMRPGAANAASVGTVVPPVVAAALTVRFAAGGSGVAVPYAVAHLRAVVERRSLGLVRTVEEWWRVPAGADGLDWEGAEELGGEPSLTEQPPSGMRFPNALPSGLDRDLARLERDLPGWRARRAVPVLSNPKLKLVREPGESREAFISRCLAAADQADDDDEARLRTRFERKMDTLKSRLAREKDELERDQAQLSSRKAEQVLGVVEGLFGVLLGSRGARSAARKAASGVRSAATRDRMRRTASASVEESENEIARLERELEDLADELQDEIDRLADEADRMARAVEEVPVFPTASRVEVVDVRLVWG